MCVCERERERERGGREGGRERERMRSHDCHMKAAPTRFVKLESLLVSNWHLLLHSRVKVLAVFSQLFERFFLFHLFSDLFETCPLLSSNVGL